MTAQDAEFLHQHCPDVLLTLHAAGLLRTRFRRRRDAKRDGANPKEIDRLIAEEEQAFEALHIMLGRIGVLPDFDENGSLTVMSVSVAKAKRSRKPLVDGQAIVTATTLADATAFLGG